MAGQDATLRRVLEDEGMLEWLQAPPDWYPLATNLRVLDRLGAELGEDVLARIGRSVPEHATFPPHVASAMAALESLDIAYHLNHRRRGTPMFDPDARHMTEGIGHYHALRTSHARALVVVTSVYPCAFDRGLVLGLAQRFEPGAELRDATPTQCRARGGACCIYEVTW